MARRSKYTEEVIEKVEQAIRLGSTYRLAALYAGISETTFQDWMRTKPAFSARVKEAEGAASVQWLAKIEKAASDGNWQAAAWKLERRYPHEYGRKVQEVDVRLTIEQEARRLAQEFGLDESEVVQEALAILKETKTG